MGQEVMFLRYKVMLMLLFFLFLTGIEGHFRQRSPTNCLSAPQFVKKAGGWRVSRVNYKSWGHLMCEGATDRLFGLFFRSEQRYQMTQKEGAWLCGTTKDVQSPLPSITCLFCQPHLLISDVSDPFLHGAFAVQYVAWRTLPLELHHSADQHQQAQRKHTGDDDGDCFHHVGLVVQLDHHI